MISQLRDSLDGTVQVPCRPRAAAECRAGANRIKGGLQPNRVLASSNESSLYSRIALSIELPARNLTRMYSLFRRYTNLFKGARGLYRIRTIGIIATPRIEAIY